MAIPQRKPVAASAKPAPKATPKAAPATTKAAPVQASATTAGSVSAKNVGEERLSVTKTLLENGTIKGQPVEHEEIDIRTFATSTATVAYGQKFRKNLGNYESVEVSVFLSVPCYAEDIENTQGQVVDKVNALFNETMEALDVEAFRTEVVGAADFGGEGAAEEAGTEGAAEDTGEITEEWVDEQDRETLIEFLAGNPVEGLDPDDYPEDDDLKTMIKSAFFPDAEGGEAGTEEAAGYTEEELTASGMDDLKAIYNAWEMGAFPAYTSKNQAVVKKKAIAAILAKQEAGG